jgi:hypothetical protein
MDCLYCQVWDGKSVSRIHAPSLGRFIAFYQKAPPPAEFKVTVVGHDHASLAETTMRNAWLFAELAKAGASLVEHLQSLHPKHPHIKFEGHAGEHQEEHFALHLVFSETPLA